MGTRPFIDTLRDIEYGHLLDELADVQQDVVDAVMETGKKGQITITLNYNPEGQGQVTIATDLKKKIPALPRGKSLFFVTPDRNLSRESRLGGKATADAGTETARHRAGSGKT